MFAFEVNDMTCGHCVSTITKAVQALDQDAKVQVDLTRRRVEIESGEADARQLGKAIEEAGYSPVPIEGAASRDVAANQGTRRSCCGSRNTR